MTENIDKIMSCSFNNIREIVSGYSEWDVIYGMFTFEFYPNKMMSCSVYTLTNGSFEKVSLSSAGIISQIGDVATTIHKALDSEDNFLTKPDQLLFTLDKENDHYQFKYEVMNKDGYSSFDEMLYFEYHLMGQIPKDDFNKSLLNNALRYHGETPVD